MYWAYLKEPNAYSRFFIGVLFPVFLIIVILIKLDTNGPVFSIQYRPGKNKNPFMLLNSGP